MRDLIVTGVQTCALPISLQDLGPILNNGFVNHVPMAAEALVAMGQGEVAEDRKSVV